ncbi:hAT family dimerization domain protein [Metarhizium robertsii]|uniref:HAT family dimerization domain protein n=1 Tax=Metarhizium robertsii TaxID=568076 RepID=A0A014QQQ3_9HYPO|nr:hAT family dimerization domain protein [Metarhizium robertsii]
MAESIRDNESSIDSLTTCNAAESSLLSYAPTENSTSCEALCESTADSSDNVYKDLDWSKYPGYAKAPHTKRQCTSWTWQHGYRIQHIKTETLYWLCKPCIVKKAHKAALYASTGGSHSQIRHLKDKHNLDSSGPIQKKRKLNFSDATSMNATIEQALINQRISNFNPDQFKTALVELPQFHDLLQLAYADIDAVGCLPTADTMVRWTKRDFEIYKAPVIRLLAEVEGNIHFTFDLWTSSNLLCLNGVYAHYLNAFGEKKKILLSVPSIDDSHTGENIAQGVADIITEFHLEKRVGYFVLDNATNNDKAVEKLGTIFGFNPTKHRIRHADGNRLRGFKALQIEHQNNLLDDDERRCPPSQLKRPNDTRWNSHYYAFETACQNRAAIDAYVEKEERSFTTRLEQPLQKNKRRDPDKQLKLSTKPAIVEDKLSVDDWITITRYMQILKPLMLVTKKLEGCPQEGRNGCMWEVLPCYEFLLAHFERLAELYKHDPDEDLRLNIQLGWQKLDEYYKKLDNTEVYVAAVALHPKYRLAKIKQMWSDREADGWPAAAERQLQDLWRDYKDVQLPEEPTEQQPDDDILDEILNPPVSPSTEDLYGPMEHLYKNPAQQQASPPDEMDELQGAVDASFSRVRDPVNFWILHRSRWPRLSRMALEIYGIPPIEADNERLYSKCGDMVTKKRNRLSANIIGAAQCLRQWDEDGIIEWK